MDTVCKVPVFPGSRRLTHTGRHRAFYVIKMKELAHYAGLGRVQEFEQIRAKLYDNVGLWTISVVVCSADFRSTSF
jgi:hypothetical protein